MCSTTVYCGGNPVGVGVTVGVEVGGVTRVAVGGGVVCPDGWPRDAVVRVTVGVTDWTVCVIGGVMVVLFWVTTLIGGRGGNTMMPAWMSRIVVLPIISRNAKRE